MEPTQLPLDPAPKQDDHLLEDSAGLTGLFNPEVIWHKEEQLDELDEQDQTGEGPDEPAPSVH